MSMKDRLKKLKVKEEQFTIPETDVTITIKGLSFPDLTELAAYGDKKDTKGATNFLLFTTLRKSFPTSGDEGWTDSEIVEFIKELDANVAKEILKKVQDMSGLGGEDDEKKVGSEGG